MPSTQHPVNKSPLNHDGRSPSEGVGCLDAQRVGKPSFTGMLNDKALVAFRTENAGCLVKWSMLHLLYWMK